MTFKSMPPPTRFELAAWGHQIVLGPNPHIRHRTARTSVEHDRRAQVLSVSPALAVTWRNIPISLIDLRHLLRYLNRCLYE
jgi:hypothetical protein